MSVFIGMNKMGHHAAACALTVSAGEFDLVLAIKERLTRVKADGGMIEGPLKALAVEVDFSNASFAENSYLKRPADYEAAVAAQIPYYEKLSALGLERSSKRYNAEVAFVPHHRCHAAAAQLVSPFEKALIVVFDGIGSLFEAFDPGDPELALAQDAGPGPGPGCTEACTVYLQDGARLKVVEKQWQTIDAEITDRVVGHDFGLGALYSIAARYIFNNYRESGKVMGLAPFGKASPIADRATYLKKLDWKKAFRGHGKSEWEQSGLYEHYADVAASVQKHFEQELLHLLGRLGARYPSYRNLILTGGCALNCVANAKVIESGLFDGVYVPPFPGDESAAVGAAARQWLEGASAQWKARPWEAQRANFGPAASAQIDDRRVREAFRGRRVARPVNLEVEVARRLARGELLGWFQGRSESGPRALGFRSLLASPFVSGVKDRLNAEVKCREAFRPYAPATLWERAHEYFDVPPGFESPFMSFSPRVRPAFRERLKEISHVDGTARLQTVRKAQSPRFHALVSAFGDETGVYCVLNTSMNVMGEPIVETIADAARFFEHTPVDAMAVGDFLVTRG